MSQAETGLYAKFNVHRTDGRDALGGDRHGAQYFVLDITHDPHAAAAARAYADECEEAYPALAADLPVRIGLATPSSAAATGSTAPMPACSASAAAGPAAAAATSASAAPSPVSDSWSRVAASAVTTAFTSRSQP